MGEGSLLQRSVSALSEGLKDLMLVLGLVHGNRHLINGLGDRLRVSDLSEKLHVVLVTEQLLHPLVLASEGLEGGHDGVLGVLLLTRAKAVERDGAGSLKLGGRDEGHAHSEGHGAHGEDDGQLTGDVLLGGSGGLGAGSV